MLVLSSPTVLGPQCELIPGRETIGPNTYQLTVNRQKEKNNPEVLQPNYIHVGFQGTA